MVYDLDGDGKSEIVMKTADGTIDGKGNVIGDAAADNRETGKPLTDMEKKRLEERFKDSNAPRRRRIPTVPRNQGRILKGNEYLTVFSGLTGEALATVDYIPPRGELKNGEMTVPTVPTVSWPVWLIWMEYILV